MKNENSNGKIIKFQPAGKEPGIDEKFQSIDPWKTANHSYSKRHLPHLFAKSATYFVTFRCDRGVRLTESSRGAVILSMLFWNGKRIDVDAAVAMPDHAHMIFRIIDEYEEECEQTAGSLNKYHAVSKMLHSIKSYSTKQVNMIVGRKGPLWMDESFDHVIRDKTEWQEKMNYVINNPVKKGLSADPSSYEWLWVSDCCK